MSPFNVMSCSASSSIGVPWIGTTFYTRICPYDTNMLINFVLTCVGLAFSLGKLILVGFNCNVDGLHGVGGRRLPCPLRATKTG